MMGIGGIGAAASTVSIVVRAKDEFSNTLRSAQGGLTKLGHIAGIASVGIAGALGASVVQAEKLDRALVGLSTVAKAFGQNADKATFAAQDLAKDGLMSVSEAAEGLKNLLPRMGLEEAIDLMNGLKDSAAFNRQGTLEFGQAIVGATQGIKNLNSIMVDNAGVTKNLSIIMKEGGFQMQDLDDKTKSAAATQVLINGLLKETAVFAGDADKMTEGLTGSMSRLKTSISRVGAGLGKPLLDPLTAVANKLGDVVDKFESLTEQQKKLVTAGAVGAAGIGGTLAIAAKLKGTTPSNPLYVADVTGGLSKAGAGVAGGGLKGAAVKIGAAAGFTQLFRSALKASDYKSELMERGGEDKGFFETKKIEMASLVGGVMGSFFGDDKARQDLGLPTSQDIEAAERYRKEQIEGNIKNTQVIQQNTDEVYEQSEKIRASTQSLTSFAESLNRDTQFMTAREIAHQKALANFGIQLRPETSSNDSFSLTGGAALTKHNELMAAAASRNSPRSTNVGNYGELGIGRINHGVQTNVEFDPASNTWRPIEDMYREAKNTTNNVTQNFYNQVNPQAVAQDTAALMSSAGGG